MNGRGDRKLFWAVSAVFVAALFFVALSAHAAAVAGLTIYSPGLDSELDAHWTFDAEDMATVVRDRTGVNNGVLILGATGNTATTTVSGPVGQALVFDGLTDYINFPVLETIDSFPFAFSFWFKTTQTSRGQFVDQSTKAQIFIESGSVKYYLNGTGGFTITSPTGYNDGKWHHALALSRSANDHELFIDGVSVGTSATNVGTVDAWYITTIGRNTSSAYFFNGALDDIRVYSRSLSLAEIQRLYHLGRAFKVGVSTLVAGGARTRIAATPTTIGTGLGNGLVGHWTFDGKNLISNVADSSGLGKNGNLILGASGNIATTTEPGVLGQALVFDGTNDYVSVSSPSLPTGDFTLSAWANVRVFSPAPTILMIADGSGGNEIWFGFNSSTRAPGFNLNDAAAVYGSTGIATSTWNHVVMRRSGSDVRIFLNNTDIGSATNGGTLNFSSCALLIGVDADQTCVGVLGNYMSGKLDDVRIYNRALSVAEIKQLYTMGRPTGLASRVSNRAPTPSNAGMFPYYVNLGGGAQNVTLYMNTWTDPDGDSVTGYYFDYFADNGNCVGTPTGNSGWIADPTSSGGYNVSVSDASGNTWRVKARDASGKESAWSECVYFDNDGGGSCPYVFGWNGEKFAFEVDIYGSGGLGYKKWGLDDFVQPAPNRTYVINNTELKNGAFEWRIVGDLNEINYFDLFRLYSVFVPENRDVIVEAPTLGSGLKAKSILHTVSTEPLLPKSAILLDTKQDITDDVSARDEKKVILNKYNKEDYTYRQIEVDFGDVSQYKTKKLIIGGSTTYPVTEEGIARKQQFGLEWGLYVQDAAGQWKKVPNNLYSPIKPLSFDTIIAVDISKIFISQNTKLRLEYLYKVYVDYIALDVTEDVPLPVAEEHPITYADLHDFGGWHDFNKDGHIPDYYDVTNLEADYEDFPGYYTRFGDVIPLLEKKDDKFVILAKADEVTVKNAAPKLAVPEGYKRVVMLDVTGFYKALMKTQTAMTVEPMPFGGMSMFPYPETEYYPNTPEYQEYLSEYNTRYLSPEKQRGTNALLGGIKRMWFNLQGDR